ncbi:AMP-binding protein [Rhodovulum kholense]|uniref:Acyl-CoA synthetase (AMP-forming)/AMP-acid ligase II n=1 Tax=Rhodovulum kholense TaxID=453584 RepID=A0A8E2VKF8_9RHOB|nr:AMP-binding protein [Rhodovulum kholense]PTW50431.1 acyl-CoA synthetase (AMP-forming)/AMP-acid ligase II [Rhodovulum kholense]
MTGAAGNSPETGLARALVRTFADRPGRERIVIRSRQGARDVFTGDRLAAEAGAVAAALRGWLGPGAHSLVLALPAGAEFVVTLLGGLLAGVTLVPVPVPRPGSHSDRFRHIAADSRAAAVLCPPAHAEAVAAALALDGTPPCPVATLPLDPARLPDPVRPAAAPDLPVAVIQYTSGSTRLPRGVRVTPDNILANAALVARCWGMDEQARFVNWLPHYHDMGLMGGILYPLLCGGFSAQMSPLDFIRRPALWLEAIAAERAGFSGGPAFAFADCLRRISPDAAAALDLTCWRRAFIGAEPVPAGLPAAFHAHFAAAGLAHEAVFACYGMAEMTLFAAGLPGADRPPPAPPAARAVAPCRLTPELGAGLAIVDPIARTRRPEGAEGEIWLRGPSLGAGYLGLPGDTAETFGAALDDPSDGSGWLRTGDLGVIAEDALYVTGRIKDVVFCNGRTLAAPEIEWLACGSSDVLNPMAAAVFMPDPARGGQAVLLAELRLGETPPDPDTLRQTIRRAVTGEWGLDLVEILFLPRGRLPRTSSGKIRRRAAAELWRDGAWPPETVPSVKEMPECPS